MFTIKRIIRAMMHHRFKEIVEELKTPAEGQRPMNRRERRIYAANALRRDKRSHLQKTKDANQVQFREHWSSMLGVEFDKMRWGVDRCWLRKQAFG